MWCLVISISLSISSIRNFNQLTGKVNNQTFLITNWKLVLISLFRYKNIKKPLKHPWYNHSLLNLRNWGRRTEYINCHVRWMISSSKLQKEYTKIWNYLLIGIKSKNFKLIFSTIHSSCGHLLFRNEKQKGFPSKMFLKNKHTSNMTLFLVFT